MVEDVENALFARNNHHVRRQSSLEGRTNNMSIPLGNLTMVEFDTISTVKNTYINNATHTGQQIHSSAME